MSNQSNHAVIIAYGRSPVGKAFKGAFADVNPIEIAGQTLIGVMNRTNGLDPALVEDVVVGCAFPENLQNYNMARQIVLRAGLPDSATAQTVSRICSSGLQSISTAANSIVAGEADVMIAGGVESMSSTTMFPKEEERYKWFEDHRPTAYDHPAITAEKVAKLCDITREVQDEFACESHRRAAAAQDAGWFDDQIIPIKVKDSNGDVIVVKKDEGIRRGTTVEGLASLEPKFLKDGCVTAGNTSQMSDGAGFVVLMSQKKAEQTGQKPIARFLGFATAGMEPEHMGLGPTKAVPKLLKRLGLSVNDLDTIEINEAFAAQSVPCISQIGLPHEKTNPEGGAIALGHPLGGTGTILTCKAISHLQRTGGKYGLITMCVGGGIGAAGIIEMI